MAVKKRKKRRPPAKSAGRKTILTPELTLLIKGCVILGWTYKKIMSELKISAGTWDSWVHTNYQGFRDNLFTYRHEHMLRLAENNLCNDLTMSVIEPVIGMFGPIIDKKTKKPVTRINDKLLKIKNDTSMFISETLGKKTYSKKTEIEDVSKQKMIILKEAK